MTPDPATEGWELLDTGDGRRLERFGAHVVDRPAPGALEPRRDPRAWSAADLRFDPVDGWRTANGGPEPWTVVVDGVVLELRPTPAGQVGLFGEHALALDWLRRALARSAARLPAGVERPRVLNLFAHTGLATLALARGGAAVVHLDASRPAVAWARRNAELSGLAEAPVRWIVDDAVGFVRREGRRGRRYDGLVLDPPTFGHGGAGRPWRLDAGLAELLEAVAAIAEPGAFVQLTAHATGQAPAGLADVLWDAFPGRQVTTTELVLTARSGARLRLGAAARIMSG